jgi:hypothetical protein
LKEDAVVGRMAGAMRVRRGSAIRAGRHHAQPWETPKRLPTPFLALTLPTQPGPSRRIIQGLGGPFLIISPTFLSVSTSIARSLPL